MVSSMKFSFENSFLKFKQKGCLVVSPFKAILLGGNLGLFLMRIKMGMLHTVM